MEGVVIPSARFWQGRRVLITGHTGFKGSWLWQWLAIFGAELSGFALAPDTEPSLFELAGLLEDKGSRFGDVRDRQKLQTAVAEMEPEIVFHLAAQALVQRSYRQPVETFETNVMGTAYLLDAIRTAPSVKCALIVTSDKCYQRAVVARAYREGDPLGGSDPYSASKACAEILAGSWRFGLSQGIATARAGNVIGGGDWAPDRLIPDCVRALRDGGTVQLRNPYAIRPWQHVLDALAGYLILAERLYADPAGFGQAWNFGPDSASCETVLAVAQRFIGQWSDAPGWVISDSVGAPEEPVLMLDAGKARNGLGWRPVLDIDDAITLTAQWYRRLASGENASRLCAEQIGHFMERAPA